MKKKLLDKIMGLANIAAFVLVIQSVNSACIWHFHQPQIPKAALKFQKYK